MTDKPTYEELEQEVKELKREALQFERAKEVLRESEERYRRITKAVTDYVFRVHIENGRPVDTVHGPGCVAVTGYSPEDFASDPYLWIRMVHEEDRIVVLEQAKQVLMGQNVTPIEHRIRRKDGVIRWTMNTLVPHCDQEGKLLSYDGLVRDIHERKKAEEELQKTHEELELRVEQRTAELVKANEELKYQMEERKRLEKILMQREKLKTLGAISAEVSHEIRNPLVAIGGFARRLKQKFPDLLDCDIILTESQRLEKILSRIKNYLEPVEIHPQECSINNVITECLNLLSPETGRRQTRCVLEPAPRFLVAYVDPDILAQVIINVIRNATEAMDKGETLLVRTFESDYEFHIEFKSKAQGLKIEHPETIFMPFAEGGRSFGLPLCFRLLKDMGGFLSFEQEEDSLIFTVTLPKKVQSLTKNGVQDDVEINLPRDRSMYS